MIKIDTTAGRSLAHISETHWKYVRSYLVKKVPTIDYADPPKPKREDPTAYATRCGIAQTNWLNFRNYLLVQNHGSYDHLEQIILCLPSACSQLHETLDRIFAISNYPEYLKKLFNYDTFSVGYPKEQDHYSAFTLVRCLDVPVCPYCNRNYISCIEKGKKPLKHRNERKLRPPLDHFYPRSEFPVFGLSFYNLIPCCSFCNSSLKRDVPFKHETHLHPYMSGFESKAEFRLLSGVHPRITLEPAAGVAADSRVEQNILEFELETLYQGTHLDLATEIREKALEHSPEHFQSLVTVLKSIKPLEADFYRFYFGNYFSDDDFEKRPLAKLTSDLVKQFGILTRAGFHNSL